MKKLLATLLMIPVVAFAEDAIYFNCNFTCVKDTTHANSPHEGDRALDGCQEAFKKGVRKSYPLKYTYYKSQNKVISYGTVFKCESSETMMRCSSLMGTRFGNPLKYDYGDMKGQDKNTYQHIKYFDIDRTTLEATSEWKYQSDINSRVIISSGKGKCEMNTLKF